MPSTIDQYRNAKAQYLKLRSEAKQDLLRRFEELANELFLIQRELLEDFEHKVAIPTKPKRSKKNPSTAGPARRAPSVKSAAAKTLPSVPKPAAVPKEAHVLIVRDDLSADEANILKHIDKNKKRLAEAHAGGKPTKPIEDRLYELEDELRLIRSK